MPSETFQQLPFTNICLLCYHTYVPIVRTIKISIKKGVIFMESILCVDIPVQMISSTDTDGKITPIRFRFRDRNGELVTITVEKVLAQDQDRNRIGANFSCAATLYGAQKTFRLRYNYTAHEWRLSRLHV